MQVQKILNRLGGQNITLNNLKSILAPIFAKNEAQQQLFYQLYDNYFKAYEPRPTTIDRIQSVVNEAIDKLPESPKKWKYLLGALMLFVLLLSGSLYVQHLLQQNIVIGQGIRELYPKIDSTYQDIKDSFLNDENQNPDNPLDDIADPNNTTELDNDILSNINERIVLPNYAPIPEVLDDLTASFWQEYGFIIWWTSLLFLLSFWTVYWLFKRQKQQVAFNRKQFKESPDSYVLSLSHLDLKLFHSPTFYQATKQLRQRQLANTTELDVAKTIHTTIKTGGFPSFEYRQKTRPSEYLALIDVPHPKDHQYRLMEQLVRELEAQDIYIDRYYYQKDPRVVWKKNPNQTVYLEELHQHYYQ
ncbi:MAG: hypothetical protein ACPGXL_08205, partial [Chitinophagales bacterium]